MKALIIIAHGSRRQQSNDEIIEMVNQIRSMASGQFDHITHSFLEICEPSLQEAVADCVSKGANEVIVYPFFLNSGNHVLRDIPDMVTGLNENHSGCEIRLMQHFGKSADIATLILDHIKQ